MKSKNSAFLIVRTYLKPVDVYAYLRARFGPPNGFQSFLRRDDSDNWIHWDFNLKADGVDVYIAGTSRDIHFHISEFLRDTDWQNLILALKADFSRIGRAKSEVMRSFEKFVVFQNKYYALANLCAEIHQAILDTSSMHPLPAITRKRSLRRYTSDIKRLGKRSDNLYGDCLKLKLMTPVMAEAFINMIILIFCKDEVRNDRSTYEAFIRSSIPERIRNLSENCHGFREPIDQTSTVYGDFKRVMDKRNFAIHGNIDPIREQIETVYFDGRRPLFVEGGDNIVRFFNNLENLNEPAVVISDYETVHIFLGEIANRLEDRYREFFEQVIDDPYPGYEVNKKRVTRILPEHNMQAIMHKIRYDDDLDVIW
ncbi:hypothetical protein [Niveispirillum irakense]|uniref:hypothetical protein n=1 Tax=Niveispirillum irakense TaxID=34011 RepID=UPI00048E0A65|nr:hypothetical protein [Niveispirillum irakense]